MGGIIYFVDDDAAVRDATSRLLMRADYRVESFPSGEHLLARPSAPTPDCILLDVRMPGLSGIEVLRQLRQRGDMTPVIVVSGHGDIPLAVEAMREGAFDFLEKPYEPDALFRSIDRACAAGGAARLDGAIEQEARRAIERLTRRQQEVLDGIVRGRANKVIAHELGLSIRTVEAYRSQMQARLGVRGFAELVKLGLAAGMGR